MARLRMATMTWGAAPLRDLAAFLVKGHILYPVQLILNTPMPQPEGEELLRSGAVRGQACDGVGHFLAGLASPCD